MVLNYELCGEFCQNSDIASGRTNFYQLHRVLSKVIFTDHFWFKTIVYLSNCKLLMAIESLSTVNI
jgi:hypothetical protein